MPLFASVECTGHDVVHSPDNVLQLQHTETTSETQKPGHETQKPGHETLYNNIKMKSSHQYNKAYYIAQHKIFLW